MKQDEAYTNKSNSTAGAVQVETNVQKRLSDFTILTLKM